MKIRYLALLLTFSCVFLLSGCVTTSGASVAEKRAQIQKMREQVLTQLFREKPDVRQQIKTAPGYAVFSNVNVNIILASFGGGYGVAKNNRTGQYTYMNMGEIGLGIGAGVKDFRVVFVFHSEEALNRFIEHGWSFGGQADAAAKASDKGAAIGGEAILDNVTVYQLTEAGLALQATLKGTKYWKNAELN